MPASNDERPKPMREPLKPHGDKLKHPETEKKRPPTEPSDQTLLEPEREGGIGGP